MNNLMFAYQIIAFIGFVALAPILHTMWKTTDGIFYSLMATLLCVLCGFISVIFIYDYIKYIQWRVMICLYFCVSLLFHWSFWHISFMTNWIRLLKTDEWKNIRIFIRIDWHVLRCDKNVLNNTEIFEENTDDDVRRATST